MWTVRSEELSDGSGLMFAIDLGSRQATFADVFRAWRSDDHFRSLYNSLLAEAPYAAFRWETPAVTTATESQPFEFVLLDSPGLARRPDPGAFAEHFGGAKDGVAVFPNLGGDAIMVVPCPISEPIRLWPLGLLRAACSGAAASRPLAGGWRGHESPLGREACLAQYGWCRCVVAACAA